MKTQQNTPYLDISKKTLIIGLGLTGYSCVRFLVDRIKQLTVLDTRPEPPFALQLQQNYPSALYVSADLSLELLQQYEQIIVSPGVKISEQWLQVLAKQAIKVLSDIGIFLQYNQQTHQTPVIAITGSNGKSTVVKLVEHLVNQSGKSALAGGNIGLPSLDLLSKQVDVYVIELSSFQLEYLQDYPQQVFLSAVVLNVSEDHMDRYQSIAQYRKVKEAIYRLSSFCVVNEKTTNQASKNERVFSLSAAKNNQYGVREHNQQRQLIFIDEQNKETLWGVFETLKIKGQHNLLNVLAALALIEPLQLEVKKVQAALNSFEGLAHRCQWIANIDGCDYYNDSKGTNTGATIAAIEGFDRPIVLIAGGIGKNADFRQLAKVICQKVSALILFGRDAWLIKQAVNDYKHSQYCHLTIMKNVSDLEAAVKLAKQHAVDNSIVLFSPACASFDMFDNYQHRGEAFVSIVEKIAQNNSIPVKQGVV